MGSCSDLPYVPSMVVGMTVVAGKDVETGGRAGPLTERTNSEPRERTPAGLCSPSVPRFTKRRFSSPPYSCFDSVVLAGCSTKRLASPGIRSERDGGELVWSGTARSWVLGGVGWVGRLERNPDPKVGPRGADGLAWQALCNGMEGCFSHDAAQRATIGRAEPQRRSRSSVTLGGFSRRGRSHADAKSCRHQPTPLPNYQPCLSFTCIPLWRTALRLAKARRDEEGECEEVAAQMRSTPRLSNCRSSGGRTC